MTRTYVTYFDTKVVDELCEKLHSTLESDYLNRYDHLDQKHRKAIEARLSMVRALWILLLDIVPE